MGPTIAGRIIAELGIGRILIPRDPGTFSAFGMLVTDVHQTRSFHPHHAARCGETRRAGEDFCRHGSGRAGGSDAGAIFTRAAFDIAQRRHALPRAVLRSQRSGRCIERRRRSRGARKTLPRGAPAPLRPHGGIRSGRDRQLPGHRGRSDSEAAVQSDCAAHGFATADAARNAHGLFQSTAATQVPVFRRSALAAGAVIDGPAVIEEKTSTTVLYPGQRAEIDGYLNIAITPAGAS